MAIDHELKQRLVGAAVITAIAAIFVPMLFDNPVVVRGKVINELAIPEPPVVLKPEAVPGMENAAIPLSENEASDSLPINQEMTPAEIAAEAAADKLASQRLAMELAETDVKGKSSASVSQAQVTEKKPTAQNTKENDRDLAAKKAQEAISERKAKQQAILEKNAALKKAREEALAEKRNADKLAKERIALEKQAKQQAQADKLAAEKKIRQQAEDYRKLVAEKAKEKALLEKKAKEKAAAEAKLAAKQQALDDKAAIVKIAADKRATEKASIDQAGSDTPAPSRWYIRMGSFGQKANAMALRDKLRKQGYPAVVDLIKTADKGSLYRLRVGPDLSKERAEKNRLRLDAANHSKSILELE